MHNHTHGHEHSTESRYLFIALAITLGFAVVEAISGWLANSLALLSDAGHMATDALALGLAALAAWLAKKPPSPRLSYGLLRAEIVAALVNSIFMLFVVLEIIQAAIHRMNHQTDVHGLTVMVVALIGLLINLAVAYVLHHGENTLNKRAALLHVMGDLLGSVAALLSGIIIYYTGWFLIDPILSLLICVLILISTFRLLREVVHVIMEGVPYHLDLQAVGLAMAKVTGVQSVHDLHIWNLSSGNIALSAHVVIIDMRQWQSVLAALKKLLGEKFDINHITLQPEPENIIVWHQTSSVR